MDQSRTGQVFDGHSNGFEEDAPGTRTGKQSRIGEDSADFGLNLRSREHDIPGLTLNGGAGFGDDPAAMGGFVVELAELRSDRADRQNDAIGLEPAALQDGGGGSRSGENHVG